MSSESLKEKLTRDKNEMVVAGSSGDYQQHVKGQRHNRKIWLKVILFVVPVCIQGKLTERRQKKDKNKLKKRKRTK